jgi:hypothetical protein
MSMLLITSNSRATQVFITRTRLKSTIRIIIIHPSLLSLFNKYNLFNKINLIQINHSPTIKICSCFLSMLLLLPLIILYSSQIHLFIHLAHSYFSFREIEQDLLTEDPRILQLPILSIIKKAINRKKRNEMILYFYLYFSYFFRTLIQKVNKIQSHKIQQQNIKLKYFISLNNFSEHFKGNRKRKW